jgi:hypothetical protein
VWHSASKHSVLGKKPLGGKVGTLAVNFQKLKSRLSLAQGRSAKHYECDDVLFKFMQNLRQQQHKVNVRLMCAEYRPINANHSEVSNYVIQ